MIEIDQQAAFLLNLDLHTPHVVKPRRFNAPIHPNRATKQIMPAGPPLLRGGPFLFTSRPSVDFDSYLNDFAQYPIRRFDPIICDSDDDPALGTCPAVTR